MSAQRTSMNPAITLGRLIEILCSETKDAPATPQTNPFHLYNLPPISFDDFAQRLGYYMACSPECFVVAATYARRLHASRPELFTTRSMHKIMLSSLLLGIKFSDDLSYPTKHYARCGGVPTEELIQLEAFFLSCLSFQLFVTDAQYAESLQLLREVHKRGTQLPAEACSMDFVPTKSTLACAEAASHQIHQPSAHVTIPHNKTVPEAVPSSAMQQQAIQDHAERVSSRRAVHRRHFSESTVQMQIC